MSPHVGETIRGLRANGALSVVAGTVEALTDEGGEIEARIRPRAGRGTVGVSVRHVIDCTGPAPLRRTAHPLLRRLLSSGLVRTDALGLGLEATRDGRLLSLANPGGYRLFAMGPLLKGTLWETTAMAEIRAQAADLARTLLALGETRHDPPLAPRTESPLGLHGEQPRSRP
jgi:uncharacterized NAD(P)/FAD-binding protein YdhS